jgi:pescadillo protein
MMTFLEFYETLVGFVNFKLYHELGLRYPPVLDEKLEKAAAELFGIMKGLASAPPPATEEPENGEVAVDIC